MTLKTICILGGTGFVGRHLAATLPQDQYRVRILTRTPAKARPLTVLPNVGVEFCNPFDAHDLREILATADILINLVGILNEKKDDGKGFHKAHVELTRLAIQACLDTGTTRYLHMSALHADANAGKSHYLRSKGEAEDLAHAAARSGLQVTSFRPSVIFGPGDSFFNRFAGLLKFTPGIFPLACAQARFAPVYVGDVVAAFNRAITDKKTIGRRYDLCGPQVYTLKQLVEFTAQTVGVHRLVIGLPDILAKIQAHILQNVPTKPFSMDNYRSLQIDSTCTDNGLIELGIKPASIESVVPRYLGYLNRGAHIPGR